MSHRLLAVFIRPRLETHFFSPTLVSISSGVAFVPSKSRRRLGNGILRKIDQPIRPFDWQDAPKALTN